MLSEEPAPTKMEAEGEALLIFIIIASTISVVMAFIFDTSQTLNIMKGVWTSVLSVPISFVVGLGHLVWATLQGAWNAFYNNTVGKVI